MHSIFVRTAGQNHRLLYHSYDNNPSYLSSNTMSSDGNQVVAAIRGQNALSVYHWQYDNQADQWLESVTPLNDFGSVQTIALNSRGDMILQAP